MTPWLFAMLCIAPVLMLERMAGGVWCLQKLRVWAVLVVATLMGWAVSDTAYAPPVLAFCIIDLAAAGAIIRRPFGHEQRMIAGLSTLMVAWHWGFAWSAGYDVGGYYFGQSALGWVQYVIFALWSVSDAGKVVSRLAWFRRHLASYWADISANRSSR